MRAAIILCLVILILNVEVGEAGDPIFASISKWMKENPGWLWVLKFDPAAAASYYSGAMSSNDENHDFH